MEKTIYFQLIRFFSNKLRSSGSNSTGILEEQEFKSLSYGQRFIKRAK
ncbi:MAG: hypothetical protein M3299_08035 [Thermoproteota archaeon]|nr:hypothetical protein [Thermoproteota archaeon]